MDRLRPALAAALLLVLGAITTGCFNPFRPLISSQTSQVESPPVPTDAREVVRLFKWCWENRNITYYREIFTDDYRFAFAVTDSAGNAYREVPWTREDELVSAQNLFVGGSATESPASSITLIFTGDLRPQPDFRPGKDSTRYHRTIQITNLTLTVTKSDGSGLQVTGAALFFLVRGDSAVIPAELRERGFGPDPNRWYIERWEDQTSTGQAPQSAAAPAAGGQPPAPVAATAAGPAAGAAQRMSWGLLKRIYREP